ncbi:hypothetical protein G9A89_020887 [Geosiphon pyriformis]|nr:hypothetical protein G9A89_020887 [Geosiphon pyriformis]
MPGPKIKKGQDITIGREPHSGVVFHAHPRHDDTLPVDLPEKEEHWQDREHIVPTPGDPKGIVGHLQKDWEKEHSAHPHGKIGEKANAPANETQQIGATHNEAETKIHDHDDKGGIKN